MKLAPGASTRVTFTLTTDQLAFYGLDGTRRAEPGEFRVWIGPDSSTGLESSFALR